MDVCNNCRMCTPKKLLNEILILCLTQGLCLSFDHDVLLAQVTRSKSKLIYLFISISMV